MIYLLSQSQCFFLCYSQTEEDNFEICGKADFTMSKRDIYKIKNR